MWDEICFFLDFLNMIILINFLYYLLSFSFWYVFGMVQYFTVFWFDFKGASVVELTRRARYLYLSRSYVNIYSY